VKKTLLVLLIFVMMQGVCVAADLKIIMTEPEPQKDKITFSDEKMSFVFALEGKKGINLRVKNLTNKVVKIDWEQVALIDVKKNYRRIVHDGILYKDRTEKQAPTTIPPIPGTAISDNIAPVDLIFLKRIAFGGWQWRSKDFISDEDENKTISVYFPIDIGGEVANYTFNFKIIKENQ